VQGVSTRSTDELKAMSMTGIPKSQVNRLFVEIDDRSTPSSSVPSKGTGRTRGSMRPT
jgi:hypothetical protein